MKTKSIEDIIKDTILIKHKEYTTLRFGDGCIYNILENLQIVLASFSTLVIAILLILFIRLKNFSVVWLLVAASISIIAFVFIILSRKQRFIENKYRYFDSLKTREIWKKKNDKNKRY